MKTRRAPSRAAQPAPEILARRRSLGWLLSPLGSYREKKGLTVTDLYRLYLEYCKSNNLPNLGQSSFEDWLKCTAQPTGQHSLELYYWISGLTGNKVEKDVLAKRLELIWEMECWPYKTPLEVNRAGRRNRLSLSDKILKHENK
jgi:phage/plasmid-associated DNA primase